MGSKYKVKEKDRGAGNKVLENNYRCEMVFPATKSRGFWVEGCTLRFCLAYNLISSWSGIFGFRTVSADEI